MLEIGVEGYSPGMTLPPIKISNLPLRLISAVTMTPPLFLSLGNNEENPLEKLPLPSLKYILSFSKELPGEHSTPPLTT